MSPLSRLHWSTLGVPTQGLEHRWAAAWTVTLDRGAAPALPAEDADLWAITAEGPEPPPALVRAMGEVGALPIVLLRSQPLDLPAALAWSALGSVRWAPLGEDAPRPGLRPLASHHAPLTAAQALGLGLVGLGPGMQQVLAKARAAAATKATVLLNGESGTGKEVVARAIHRMSAEADGPFVPVHCGAIPENLIESELFGYTKGAFTDARKDTPGKFREADGGTLFLDEVATMPLAAQVRLLRVLQEREVQPLGGGGPVKVDVRVVAATNRGLRDAVASGTFRADLYHRLSVYPVEVPPLRERGDDVLLLAGHFLEVNRARLGLRSLRLDGAAEAALLKYDWPGNVRELEHVIGRAALKLLSRGVGRADIATLSADLMDLQDTALSPMTAIKPDEVPQSPVTTPAGNEAGSLREQVERAQRHILERSLRACGGNWAMAARQLGVDPSNLHKLAHRLGLK